MKGCTKGYASQVLADWVVQNGGGHLASWNSLQNPEKRQVLVALLEEQGYVCVYCGRGVDTTFKSAHIEHFRPQSVFPALRYDWANLFVSCGPASGRQQPRVCGDAKENWVPIDHVEPTDPSCEWKFEFDGFGHIAASSLDVRAATNMIGRLNLSDASLDYERAQIIAELELQLEAGTIDASNVAGEIKSWRARDKDNRLKAFGHVAARYLEDQDLV